MKIKEYPSQETLKEYFSYEDGKLIWKVSKGRIKPGVVAGTPKKLGYESVCVDGNQCQLHRLIYIFHHGEIPENFVIDHKDANPRNNRIENLQAISQRDNLRKQRIYSNNSCGFKGVTFHKDSKKWRANIKTSDGKQTHLGMFTSAELAALAYNEAANFYYGEFAHLNQVDVAS